MSNRAVGAPDVVGETQRQGLAVTRKQGSFVTVVGPEAYVGDRKLAVLGLAGMFAKVGGRLLASRLRGPRYHFAGPLGPDFDATDRLIVQPGLRPVIDRSVPFDETAVREALEYVASHRAGGKVVISMGEIVRP